MVSDTFNRSPLLFERVNDIYICYKRSTEDGLFFQTCLPADWFWHVGMSGWWNRGEVQHKWLPDSKGCHHEWWNTNHKEWSTENLGFDVVIFLRTRDFTNNYGCGHGSGNAQQTLLLINKTVSKNTYRSQRHTWISAEWNSHSISSNEYGFSSLKGNVLCNITFEYPGTQICLASKCVHQYLCIDGNTENLIFVRLNK